MISLRAAPTMNDALSFAPKPEYTVLADRLGRMRSSTSSASTTLLSF